MKSPRFAPINVGITYRSKRGRLRFLNYSLYDLINKLLPPLAERLFEANVSERTVEYPFVHQNLNLRTGSKILDVGCCFSALPIELAILGYSVWGVDVLDYSFSHNNFTFLKGDVLTIHLPKKFFDAVVAVSTIEHIGLGRWGDIICPEGDVMAVRRIHDSLKEGGRFIFTVPFGKKGMWYHGKRLLGRVYDDVSLTKLLRGFGLSKVKYALKKKSWNIVNNKEIRDVDRDRTSLEEKAIAMVVCLKKC